MRISDWSSDVCSSDLHRAAHAPGHRQFRRYYANADGTLLPDAVVGEQGFVLVHPAREIVGKSVEKIQHRAFTPRVDAVEILALVPRRPIGSASRRERVCQYV